MKPIKPYKTLWDSATNSKTNKSTTKWWRKRKDSRSRSVTTPWRIIIKAAPLKIWLSSIKDDSRRWKLKRRIFKRSAGISDLYPTKWFLNRAIKGKYKVWKNWLKNNSWKWATSYKPMIINCITLLIRIRSWRKTTIQWLYNSVKK